MDLVVEGKAYLNGVFQNCSMGIIDGKISAIKKTLKGLLVLFTALGL